MITTANVVRSFGKFGEGRPVAFRKGQPLERIHDFDYSCQRAINLFGLKKVHPRELRTLSLISVDSRIASHIPNVRIKRGAVVIHTITGD